MNIEVILYEISSWFLMPVLLIIIALFSYALFMFGGFAMELYYRFFIGKKSSYISNYSISEIADTEKVELDISKELEYLRLVSRIAPLLGLVATMIPMGPALAGVASGEMMVVGEQVGIAFSAVIVALLAACICFYILTIRRGWRMQELYDIENTIRRKELS